MGLTLPKTRERIDRILERYRAASGGPSASVLPAAVTSGKTYEAWVLCRVIEQLVNNEGYDAVLVESDRVVLKSAPGPINRSYAHFELRRSGSLRFEVWTDIEFVTLSAAMRGVPSGAELPCDYHELDIVVVPHGLSGRPRHDQIALGVECKHVSYTKDMLRSLLGVRRELSLLTTPAEPTEFATWPRDEVPAHPPSCLLACSSDRRIEDFTEPAETFGVDLRFEPLP